MHLNFMAVVQDYVKHYCFFFFWNTIQWSTTYHHTVSSPRSNISNSHTLSSLLHLYLSLDYNYYELACKQQTHFRSLLLSSRGREATTGNASAVRKLIMNQYNDQFPVGLLAQLVRGAAPGLQKSGSESWQAWFFQAFFSQLHKLHLQLWWSLHLLGP